jgi:two-component system response regulator NreC
MLSMYGNEGYVVEALQAGARAYVLKESTADELVRAIREVITGRHYLSPPLSEEQLENYRHKTTATSLDPYDTLTSREQEVLHLALQGSTSTDIANKLSISRRTVEIHRGNMMRKLGVHTQTQLLRYAAQRGILPVESDEKLKTTAARKSLSQSI